MKKYYIVCLLMFLSGFTFTYGSDLKHIQDSLIQQLAKTTSVDKRMVLLKDLSFLCLNDSNGVEWLQVLRKEASNSRSEDYEDWSIRNLTRFYYNMGDLDSVIFYAAQSDSLAKITGIFSDYYYDSQTFLCQFYLWDGQMEKAADTAVRLYQQAKKNDNDNGIICSSETLGLINQRIGRDSTAVSFFSEGMSRLLKKTGEQRYIIQFLTNIIESELKLQRYNDVHTHLALYQDYLDKLKDGHFGPDPSFPFTRCYALAEAYNIDLAVGENNIKEAKMHIDKITPMLKEVDDMYVHVYYLQSIASYYKLTGQYTQALSKVDEVIDIDPSPDALKLRAGILFDMGNTKEAAIQYREALKQNEEMNSTAFVRQLSQLQTLYNINNLELQVKELRVKELELDAKQQQLKWTFALLTILVITLLIGSYSYLHVNKLKNELQKDKQALLESENKLRIARNQAEESDRLKSLFLSNMSHEIRTPLNAIVGFAQILEAETNDGDERKEYTHIITENSALLLNLVNDILDISRLESERYRFTFAEQNLADCCRSALNSVEHRVKEGVELKFTPADETFVLNTDKLRLQQVLINLIGNASKFTEKGYIELAFTIDKANNQVRFTVTDTGCGIPADKQDAIFERFEKLNECVQGTGLGLSICRIIADRFSGEVLLDKGYTNGARFIFTHSLNV